MKLELAAALAGAALMTACASGPDAPRPTQVIPSVLLSGDTMMLVSFDTNADLRVDQAEVAAGVTREFARADANHDNSLTPLEFQAWSAAVLGGANAPPYRLDFDRNVDNAITAEEFTAEINARFEDYDKDHDGVLTRAEFVRDAPRAPMMRGGPDGGGGPPGGGQRRPPGG